MDLSIVDLPDEILLQTLLYLSAEEIASFAQACTRFRRLSFDQGTWFHLVQQLENKDFYVLLLKDACNVRNDYECDWRSFVIFQKINGDRYTKAYYSMKAIESRCRLPPSNPKYLRFYLYVYYGDPTNSPKQIMPLLMENCNVMENGKIEMTFKPPKSQHLKDCVYLFFGEGGYRSTVSFVMVNRMIAGNPEEVLYSEVPYSNHYHGYHFYNSNGFAIKISTLGSTQREHLSKFLNKDLSSFNRDFHFDHNSLRQYYGTGREQDTNQTTRESRPLNVGDVMEIRYIQSLERIYKAAYCLDNKSEEEEEEDDSQ